MEEKNKKIKYLFCLHNLFVSAIFFFGFFCNAQRVQAASFYFSPKAGSYQVGKNIAVSIYASAQESVNAFQGTINFPEDKLQLVSVSKSGSIMSLWVQEPSFSNTNGTAQFEGVVLNPGFTGSGGKILTLTFKAKASGVAEVFFGDGSILANDGAGTNVLSGFGRASFSLLDSVGNTPDTAPVQIGTGVPSAPKIMSSNCPEDGWCVGNDPAFSWVLSSGVTAVSMVADHNPTTDPGSRSDGFMSTFSYSNVEDGVWYFHIKLRNANGWSAITHYKFQVDTKNPDPFNVSLLDPISAFDPKAKLFVEAKDVGSGVARYEIRVDEQGTKTWIDDGRHIFLTEPLEPGKHTIYAKVFDNAGNSTADSVDVEVLPIDAPTITDYPETVPAGEVLSVKIRSYPKATITFFIQKEGGEVMSQFVVADSQGNARVMFDNKLTEGVYTIWAQAVNDKGARSSLSEKVTVVVTQRALLRIGSLLVSYLSILVSLLSLVLLLAALVVYTWRKLQIFKFGVRKEVEAVEKSVHIAFDELRESARKHIASLEKVRLKRELTKEEAKILTQLKNQLTDAERIINKGVEQIEKRVK